MKEGSQNKLEVHNRYRSYKTLSISPRKLIFTEGSSINYVTSLGGGLKSTKLGYVINGLMPFALKTLKTLGPPWLLTKKTIFRYTREEVEAEGVSRKEKDSFSSAKKC